MENKYIQSKFEDKHIYYYNFIIDKVKLRELLEFNYNLSHMDSLNVLIKYQEYITSKYSNNIELNIKKERSAYSSVLAINIDTENKNLFEKIKLEMNIFEESIITYIDIIAEEFKINPFFINDKKFIEEINIKLDDLTTRLSIAKSVIISTGKKEQASKLKI